MPTPKSKNGDRPPKRYAHDSIAAIALDQEYLTLPHTFKVKASTDYWGNYSMRLGTKSCAECRMRKVRCNFPQNSHICEYCALHVGINLSIGTLSYHGHD